MFRYKKILVPLDGSEYSERALEPAVAIAQAMHSELVLFRVAQRIPRTQALAEMPDVYYDVVEAAHREAEDYLTEIRDRLLYDNISIAYKVPTDPVAVLIIEFGIENQIDLIVMTSHGRSGRRLWAHGSVAEKVLNGACCATLIIRDPQDAIETNTPVKDRL